LRRFWHRVAMLQYDSGLAASPPQCYILKWGGEGVLSPRDRGIDRHRPIAPLRKALRHSRAILNGLRCALSQKWQHCMTSIAR
jgi:hypothetical protein